VNALAESPANPARRVLFLAFYFPPLGGGGVQRSVKFVRYLPELGYEPVVVTGPARGRTRHAPLDVSSDESLAASTRIARMEGNLPDDSRPDRWARWFQRPSTFEQAWSAGCIAAGRRAAGSAPVDVIFATMSPFETSRAAAALSAELGVPWVADLRDPWALDEMTVYPTRWHRALAERRMGARLASASRVVMNTPEAGRALRERFAGLAERTAVIPNGFDPEDFGPPPQRPPGDPFRIVHVGSLHAALGAANRRRRRLRRWVGGERVPVDILARSHVHLLRALERWQRDRPDEVANVELVLAGDLSAADRDTVARSCVRNRVRMPGYVSHAEAIRWLQRADLLFLPMHGLPPGERARIVPGKAYEYLGARRPILAAVPEGDARDFVLASGLGEVCGPDEVEAMEAIARRRYAGRYQKPTTPVDAAIRRFERRALSRALADELDRAIAQNADKTTAGSLL